MYMFHFLQLKKSSFSLSLSLFLALSHTHAFFRQLRRQMRQSCSVYRQTVGAIVFVVELEICISKQKVQKYSCLEKLGFIGTEALFVYAIVFTECVNIFLT